MILTVHYSGNLSGVFPDFNIQKGGWLKIFNKFANLASQYIGRICHWKECAPDIPHVLRSCMPRQYGKPESGIKKDNSASSKLD